MREYMEPIYFPFQGTDYSQSGRQSSASVKKSHSVLNGGSVTSSVLGKFLKITKSKSDVQGRPKSRASTYNGYDVEEDFRLSPSVLHRGPVEKMVHKSNSRKDVSRSHSWIYGSVKLPSDLPFGYEYSIGGNHSHSPSGSESNSGGSGSPTSNHQTHGMTALSIPRCQMFDYYNNSSCDCNCMGDFDFLTAGPSEPNNGPCKGCMREWALTPTGGKNSKGRKQGTDKGNTFVSSVRKLTWKSLKQAVKKRPSLDNLKRANELRVGVGGSTTPSPFISSSPSGGDIFSNPNGIPMVIGSHGDLLEGNPAFYHPSQSPQHAFSADDLQPSYFFPEKKNVHSSCTDIYRDPPPPHVTASVRVRPKPSRQSWHFPNESGPVPNYQEDDLYHSEWDLRQCIPYDVWVSTTSNIKPRTTMPSNINRSKTPTPDPSPSRNTSLSKSTSVPYLSEISKKSQNSSKSQSSGLNGKSSSSGAVNNNSDAISLKSVASSKGSTSGQGSYHTPTSNGVVKRPSILSSDVNAYQLLKAQTRNAKNSSNPTNRTAVNKTATTKNSSSIKGDDLSDGLSSSSDDLSDNALTSESHMRIAGQKIYMAPNLKANQLASAVSSSSTQRSNSSSSSPNKSSTLVEIQNKKSTLKQGKPSINTDEWSNSEEKPSKKHVTMNRDRIPNKGNKSLEGENMKNDQQQYKTQNQQPQRNGIQVNPNNGNYCRENNGAQSSFAIENSQSSTASNRLGQSSQHNGNTNQTPINQYSQQIQQRDSLNGNECVEFEEYEFEDQDDNFHNQNESVSSKLTDELSSFETSKSCRNDSTTSLGKNNMRNPLANSYHQQQMQKQQQRISSYVKKGQNNKTHNQSLITSESPKTSFTSLSNNNGSTNNNKFSGLRRRKSRNGSNNPGKLLREVIYEEDIEHENTTMNDSFSHGEDDITSSTINKCGSNYVHENNSQSSNKSKEYAVKIIVSHTGSTEYVKPILKNRERVYDTPILNGSSMYENKNSFNNGHNNNEIYFDSSLSTTSLSKKKVQFDQNKVIVCGGDSGPDSDDYTNEEPIQEKSKDNKKNNDYENDHDDNQVDYWKSSRTNSGDSIGLNNEMNSTYNHHYQSSNEESGSVSLKSNLSRKSALTDNNDNNLSQNQSREFKQKLKSSFEEEVVRKAASFALSRSKKQADVEAKAIKAAAAAASSLEIISTNEECYDGSVNNLKEVRLNEDQSRLTLTSNNNHNMTTFNKPKSNLKSNTTTITNSNVSLKPIVSKNSQGTGSITRNNPDPTQQSRDNASQAIKTTFSNSENSKGKLFLQKPMVKTSHGVTSNVMKAQRNTNFSTTANSKSPVESSSQQQKIINPNSLLFNDTTRIRLNQSRPSMNETFKLDLSQNGQGSRYGSNNQLSGVGPVAKSIRIKQSNSFRSIGSAPLRPKEPPPPPPTALQRYGSKLQKSISTSALTGQNVDKVLSKSLSSNQLHNGNRLLTKSEISLPIALQNTTSNQASSSVKNENIYGQKDNRSVNSNGTKGSSGFETNSTKSALGGRTSLNLSRANIESNNKKFNANPVSINGSSRSKSLTDRCEALDKILGQQHKAKANATTTTNYSNNKEFGVNNNNKNNDNQNNHQHKEIEGKVHELQNVQIINGQKLYKTASSHSNLSKSSSQQSQLMLPTPVAEHQSQNIEIVTKENSVSEIRIYSGTNIDINKGIYESTKTIINNEKNRVGNNIQEIHYAATDLFPNNEFLNGRTQFRQPAPLPSIPTHESVISPTCPQSTSVVLIIDNNNDKAKSTATGALTGGSTSSSPLTYSQPVDTLTRQAPYKPLPLAPSSPQGNFKSSVLTSKANNLSFSHSNNSDPQEGDEISEPLYDDVINHSTTDFTTKVGSISRNSIISSISSRKQNSRKSILESSSNGINRPSHLPPEPPGQIVSSTLPCLACPPLLPPPNLPSKNLSEYHHRPVVLDEDEGDRTSNSFNDPGNDLTLDEEVDNLYNDISDGGSLHGGSKSLQSFASSMKGALLNAIKSMDFDRRSMISTISNNSNGSGSTKRDGDFGKLKDTSCEGDNFIYDDTLSLRSSNCAVADTSRSYYHASFTQQSNVKSQNDLFTPTKAPLIHSIPSLTNRNVSHIPQPLSNLIEQDESISDDADNEPLYDDVVNIPSISNQDKSKDTSNSSDSGTESEDATPPPLPAQGPPIHLRSKIAAELPLLPISGLRAFEDSGSEMSRESSMEKVIGIITEYPLLNQSSSLASGQNQEEEIKRTRQGQGDVLTRTKSLLHELNEKLSQLNIISPDSNSPGPNGLLSVELSSLSPNKATISSSSESSGVEEDYNSEKNYSLSNSSDGSSPSAEENYKLAQVSKLVTETITMARGKFLNSMKDNNRLASGINPLLIISTDRPAGPLNNGRAGSSPCITEEPIYEEIGDLNRSTSPIYSDAFDAKSIFDGASRNEILSFLESIRDRLTTSDSNSSGSQSSSISSKKGHESSSRNDSGIGPADALVAISPMIINGNSTNVSAHHEEITRKLILRRLCPDCNDVPVDNDGNVGESETITSPNGIIVCLSCNRKRSERKEIIMEIHETEMKYGRDLKIISEEFYKPIQIAGLLSKEQLDQIFLNVVELMEISAQLTAMLKVDIQAACSERNDEELSSVNVGKIFLDIGENMMTAFQAYCTRQANAGALLAQLEKEKELLKVYLRVSQMENTVLRRMNLPAFLMVPVQRVTRYPLLLSRLLKVTPMDHFSRDELQSAHEKIEQHLEHMNKSTREVASVKLWRRISIINGNSTPLPRRSNNELEGASVSIRKMAIDVLDWANLQDVTCVMDSQLNLVYFNGKPLRGIYGCLLVRGKDLEKVSSKMDNDMFFPPAEDIVKEVKLVLVRVKNTRFCLLREPLCLSKCVISQGENEFQDSVEINEITSKNTYHLQGMDKQTTANWLKYMTCYSMCVGQWRRRRDALANIMMNGMLKHL